MTNPSLDAHVRFDLHPTHPSAVTAILTGSQAHIPHVGLEAGNWSVVAPNTLVLARIDHEEPYYAEQAARELTAGGSTVEITPRLREAMDEEWTWATYPMPWCTRSEIREVSDQAQKIYDDIRHGHLLIHAHAHDGHTTVAVGTYLHRGGTSVYLHGEDHLRQIADTFDSPAKALSAFEKVHGSEMRPGPALPTDTERAAAEARKPLTLPAAIPPTEETVPAYAADAGNHDALLDRFLAAHGDWQRWRTWSDETTHAIHESQTLRIERIHEARAGQIAWIVAAYETPVSERIWALTATGATPEAILQNLLEDLSDGHRRDRATGASLDEETVNTATRPLIDAGWHPAIEGRCIRWTAPGADAGVQLDAFTAQRANDNLDTWTVWAGPSLEEATWTLTASPHTPSSLLATLTENLTQKAGTHGSDRTARPNSIPLRPSPPATAPPAERTSSRRR
ncbi:DUF317 domain-containing protein [Streptomyces sp. 8L]|uniref:DUF317 domain-containing protein n=1 Tax=Streptomyces sp. 8L TaxID=2877242 RepID=UPI001CD3A0CC|nr:DUF317 domain-containing protein [Streptomyces sp. 8L]MCA1221310.1 DUF317 domain-containing protein [Streptomyces sp. 8L]